MTNDWILIKNSKTKKQLNLTINSKLPPPPKITFHHENKYSILAKGDSAASHHYFTNADKPILDNVEKDYLGPTVLLPNSSTLTSTETGDLPGLPTLSKTGKKTAIFNNLHTSLISLGQLCDDGCKVTLTKETLEAKKNGKTILVGNRSTSGDGLWDIPLP